MHFFGRLIRAVFLPARIHETVIADAAQTLPALDPTGVGFGNLLPARACPPWSSGSELVQNRTDYRRAELLEVLRQSKDIR